jgi:hypothetical protein
VLLACLGVLAVVDDAFAQRGFGRNRGVTVEPNAAYDGRFTFARLRYNTDWRSGWEFDYPEMERNLMTMINEITTINAHPQRVGGGGPAHVVINYNTDIGDYMEHSGRGWWPVNVTNDAYKFATNYLVYGLSR